MTDSSINKLHAELSEIALNRPADNYATRSRIRDAFYNYQLGHCYHPQKLHVPNYFADDERKKFEKSHLPNDVENYPYSSMIEIEVPCGQCYYCRNNKINEWVTRCYAHLADFKNAYFITLTYSPYYSLEDNVSSFMINYLEGALFHYDDYNKNNRLGWNPCVLCKKHYQDFFKRLRKNTGIDDITYIVCGEYGSDFGRPHFHAILFTNSTLTWQDIKRAWSVALVHKSDGSIIRKTSHKLPYFWDCKDRKHSDYYFYQSIGRTSFDDLVINGTISNEDIMVDGKRKSSHQCFAYVCKYCAKSQCNNKRLSLAFNELNKIYNLYRNESNSINFLCANGRILPREVVSRERFIYDEVGKSRLYVSSAEQLFEKYLPDVSLCSYGSPYTLGQGLLQIADPVFTYQQIYPNDYHEFLSAFGCFLCPSRGVPIGSLYLKTHIEEMADGSFHQPPLQTQGFVVPKYFLNKVDSYIYGLRKYNSKGNAQKGNIKLVQRLLQGNTDDGSIIKFSTNRNQVTTVDEMLNSSLAFVDAYTKERMLIYDRTINGVSKYRVSYFKYNRSARKYEFLRSTSLESFIQKYALQLGKYFDILHLKYENSRTMERKRALCEQILSGLSDLFPKDDLNLTDGINTLTPNQINALFDANAHTTQFELFCRESTLRLMQNVDNLHAELKLHKHKDNE